VLTVILSYYWFGLANAQCICPNSCGSGYFGTLESCHCWAQNMANANQKIGTVGFAPAGSFSQGACQLCFTGPSSSPVRLPVSQRVCNGGSLADGRCSPYFGDLQSCTNWCGSMAATRQMTDWNCGYFPSGSFSSGGCSLIGFVDPCK
jgi:hypothetical protein